MTDAGREMLARLHERFPGKEYLTRAEAATVLGVSTRVINKMVEQRTIKAVMLNAGGLNRHYVISKTEIARCGT